MVAHIDVFKAWVDTIHHDIDAWKAVLESSEADTGARQLAAAALSYLVSRMDLVPDWNEGIGMLDDVMVLRVCAQLTQDHERGPLPAAAEVSLGRMANEADRIADFVGSASYDKLRVYCAKLVDQATRGRTPGQLVGDAALRKALYVEIDDEIKRRVPIVVSDPADAEVRLKAYLTHKLT
ncbi:MAG TPA: YkvA family protein [Kofleriaceae bacterium]|nr:YkvA family protein [Kofleriaceae bacterium]